MPLADQPLTAGGLAESAHTGQSARVSDQVDRELTARERAILTVLVERAKPSHPLLASQLDGVRVVGTCGCGCPTIHFADGANDSGIEKVADVAVSDTLDAVLLFVSDSGRLSSLEYMWIDEAPAEFPSPESLGPDNR